MQHQQQLTEPLFKGRARRTSTFAGIEGEGDEIVIRKKQYYFKIFMAFIFVGLFGTMVVVVNPIKYVTKFADWVDNSDLGWLGWLAYFLLCIICNICLLPQTPLEAAAGIIWSKSLYRAFLAAFIGKQFGSWACFAISRVASSRIERRVTRSCSNAGTPPMMVKQKKQAKGAIFLAAVTRVFSERPHTLTFLCSGERAKRAASYVATSVSVADASLEEDEHSHDESREMTTDVMATSTNLTNLLNSAAALPAWIKNYGLATIPDVSFWGHFVPWTAFCGLFYSIANVMVGSQIGNEVNDEKTDGNTRILMYSMAAVTVVGIVALSTYTKRELTRIIEELDEEARELARSSMEDVNESVGPA